MSWVAMTTTHELGHLVGGWIGGATLTDVDLAPWRLPYSVHQPDPYPLLTLWSGPVLGIAAPLIVASISRWRPAIFIADFCLLANGSYLALAWISGDRLLDTARLLDAGTPPWSLAVFCGLTVVIGYLRFRGTCAAVLFGRNTATSKKTSRKRIE